MPRPVLRAALTAALVGAGLLAVPAGAAPPAAPAFTPGTVVDPVLGGTAPVLVTDLSAAGRALDRSFVAWRPPGAPDALALYRSDDGARSYVKRYADPADVASAGAACGGAQTLACLPGPGTGAALAVEPRSGELLLAAGTTAVSRDGGGSVTAADTDLVSAPGAAVGAVALTSGARLVARQGVDGVRVARGSGAAGSWSLPALPSAPGVAGGLVADRQGRVYLPLLRDGRAVVAVSTDGGRAFAVRGPSLPARTAPRLAVDTAGGLALVVVRPDGGVVLTRSPAGAGRWSAPRRVDGSGRPAGATSASVVAGDPGRLAVAWYGARSGAWAPRLAVTTDGRAFAAATVSRGAAVLGRPTAALATPPALALDARGHLLVAWTSATGPLPVVLVARQARGASLLRGRPAAARPLSGSPGEAAGDARYPLAGRAPGPRRPGLDLTGTAVSLRPDGVLEVRLGLADAARLGAPDGLEQAKYVTRFELDGRSHYAGAVVDPGSDRPRWFAGTLGSAQVLRAPGPSGPSARAHSYPTGDGVTGRVEAGRLVVHVPARLVGRPRAGSRLLSLTSSALLGPRDASQAARLPVVVDSTPAADVVLGRPALVDGLVTALPPARLLDTRRTGGAVRPGTARAVRVDGVPRGATSVLLQVTALRPAADGEVRVGTAAVLPVSRGRTTGSLVLTALAPGGRVPLGSTTPAHLLVDVVGVVRDGAGSGLTTTRRRLLDTRGGAPLSSTPRRVAAPAGARAVLLSVTVPAARAEGAVQVWGAGGRRLAGGAPAEPGRVLTTTLLSQVAADGTVGLATTAGAAHAVVDVVGVLGSPAGGRTFPVPPVPVVDTRASGTRTRPGQVLLVRTAGLPQVPRSARQVVLQVTAYGATAPGFVTVWEGGPRPDAASLRLVPGRTTTGLVVVDVPPNRAPSVYVSAGTPHLRVDVVGATHP